MSYWVGQGEISCLFCSLGHAALISLALARESVLFHGFTTWTQVALWFTHNRGIHPDPSTDPRSNMRFDDAQLLCLSEKARTNGTITGVLVKKSGEPRIQRWQRRYCCIYRNMLFYFESERSAKPNGVVFLEHCTCLVVPTADEKVCLHRWIYTLKARLI